MMNPEPPPVPRAFRQGRSGDRPWPGDAAWRSPTPRQRTEREPAVVLDEISAAIAAKALPGMRLRRSPKRALDGQARSRSRGSTSSL